MHLCHYVDGLSIGFEMSNGKNKKFMGLVTEVLFTDDHALMSHEENDLQVILDRLSTAVKLFGLTISLRKTESLFMKAPDMVKTHPYPTFKIDNITFHSIKSFENLGSVISSNVSLNIEIIEKINKTSQALVRP